MVNEILTPLAKSDIIEESYVKFIPTLSEEKFLLRLRQFKEGLFLIVKISGEIQYLIRQPPLEKVG